MEKREQDMLERIRSASDGLQVPEALAPDQIRKKLEEAGAAGKEEETGRTKQEKDGKGASLPALCAGPSALCPCGGACARMPGRGGLDAGRPVRGRETRMHSLRQGRRPPAGKADRRSPEVRTGRRCAPRGAMTRSTPTWKRTSRSRKAGILKCRPGALPPQTGAWRARRPLPQTAPAPTRAATLTPMCARRA